MSAPFWRGYRDRRDAVLRDVDAVLRQLTLGAAVQYRELLVQDHERFEWARHGRLEFYMTSYAQPINVLLRRA